MPPASPPAASRTGQPTRSNRCRATWPLASCMHTPSQPCITEGHIRQLGALACMADLAPTTRALCIALPVKPSTHSTHSTHSKCSWSTSHLGPADIWPHAIDPPGICPCHQGAAKVHPMYLPPDTATRSLAIGGAHLTPPSTSACIPTAPMLTSMAITGFQTAPG